MLDGPYADPSVSSLSLVQFNQSDSANGKITPAVLLPLMVKWTVPCWSLEMPKRFVYFASWGKIKIALSPLAWADQDWIGLMIFKNFAEQDWIGFSFIRSGLDSDWKISQSAHLCYQPSHTKQRDVRLHL